jgi:hypothetical protein
MKRILAFIIAMLLLVDVPAFAAGGKVVKYMKATFESVTSGNLDKGKPEELKVKTESGASVCFLVKSSNIVYTYNWERLNLAQLKKGTTLKIRYITDNGANEAITLQPAKE